MFSGNGLIDCWCGHQKLWLIFCFGCIIAKISWRQKDRSAFNRCSFNRCSYNFFCWRRIVEGRPVEGRVVGATVFWCETMTSFSANQKRPALLQLGLQRATFNKWHPLLTEKKIMVVVLKLLLTLNSQHNIIITHSSLTQWRLHDLSNEVIQITFIEL